MTLKWPLHGLLKFFLPVFLPMMLAMGVLGLHLPARWPFCILIPETEHFLTFGPVSKLVYLDLGSLRFSAVCRLCVWLLSLILAPLNSNTPSFLELPIRFIVST